MCGLVWMLILIERDPSVFLAFYALICNRSGVILYFLVTDTGQFFMFFVTDQGQFQFLK
jgi:hypothetical protein